MILYYEGRVTLGPQTFSRPMTGKLLFRDLLKVES